MTDVKTTLNFFGCTEEAIHFYQEVLDAELLFLMRFRDSPDQSNILPDMSDKVFHATFRIGATEFMASDVGCHAAQTSPKFDGFSLAVRVNSIDTAERHFQGLSDGGDVLVPLGKTFFAERYGIVVDKFGISWKIIVESETKPG